MMNNLVIAMTRALPPNWLGLTIAKGLRRPVIRLAGDRGFDTKLWGMQLRLYPRWNACEKGALFTPQLYDVIERAALRQAINTAAERPFVFVDIGANVGLYSLWVAAETGDTARIVAIEPQPQLVQRLAFNAEVNKLRSITVVPVAATTAEGKVTLSLNSRDAGGATLQRRGPGQRRITVAAKPLTAILHDAGITRIDGLKIDVEGTEDDALMPFLAEAPSRLLPRLVIIEDGSGFWKSDVFARLRELGYTEAGGSKHNRVLNRH